MNFLSAGVLLLDNNVTLHRLYLIRKAVSVLRVSLSR